MRQSSYLGMLLQALEPSRETTLEKAFGILTIQAQSDITVTILYILAATGTPIAIL